MHITLQKLCLPFLLCVSSTGQAADRVYKWVDVQGVTHYARQPPVTGNASAATIVDLNPNVIQSIPLPAGTMQTPVTKRASTTQRIPASARIDRRQMRCERARNRLKKVRARLRAGYKYRQYSRLHAREAEYRAQRKAWCR